MLCHLLKPGRGRDQTPPLSVAKRLFISQAPQPVGTCQTDVSLAGVRDQTNYCSALSPGCLSASYGLTFCATLRFFSNVLIYGESQAGTKSLYMPMWPLVLSLGDFFLEACDRRAAQAAWVRLFAAS